jgi:hypothetical protein
MIIRMKEQLRIPFFMELFLIAAGAFGKKGMNTSSTTMCLLLRLGSSIS